MLWLFNDNKNALETDKKLCSVNNQGVITDHQDRKQFTKNYSDDSPLRDECLSDFDQDNL